MENLGFIFRNLRLDRNYSLSEVSEGILSPSFLSKFERGDSDISLSKFYLLLERLNITMDEFLFISNDYRPTQMEVLMRNVRVAYENNNLTLLLKLEQVEIEKLKKYNFKSYEYNAIMIRALAHNLDKKVEMKNTDIESLNNYLFSIENWGLYELMLFGNSMSILSIDSIITFSKEILNKTQMYRSIKKNKEHLVRVLLNIIVSCIELNRTTSISYFITSAEKIIERSDLYFEKIKLLYLTGIYKIIIGNSPLGVSMCKKAIQIMYDLNDINTANNHEEYLKGKLRNFQI
ncbi:helix-turn-helix domain-containing protein [Metasolibacillus sp. FSL K6-0083]|uniref:helix-turn-helix domain-containing protein n=1 Tax=Metasolibacillus sp. FSL K6-0083 TaxID=2921416 RepID=UPI00315A73AB